MTGYGLTLILKDRSRTVKTTSNKETIEVIKTEQRHRLWSLTEKSALVRRTYEPDMSMSLVARQEVVTRARCSSCASSNVKVL